MVGRKGDCDVIFAERPDVTPEEQEWIDKWVDLYGGKKKAQPTTCACLSRAGVPKKSFSTERQARIWSRTSGRPYSNIYKCADDRWHIAKARKKIKKKSGEE